MKLKNIATIKIGLSNKLSSGNQEINVFDLKTFNDKKNNFKKVSLTDEMIKKYSINENMILISQTNLDSQKVARGKYFNNWLIGKNIYAIEFTNLDYLESFYYLVQNSPQVIPTQGSVISQIIRTDLLELEIPLISPEKLKILNNIEKVILKQEETIYLLKQYKKAIVLKTKDNNE